MRSANRTNFQMLIADLALGERQPIINIKRKRLLNVVTAHGFIFDF
jgi:hypothetical protein